MPVVQDLSELIRNSHRSNFSTPLYIIAIIHALQTLDMRDLWHIRLPSLTVGLVLAASPTSEKENRVMGVLLPPIQG